MRVVRVLHTLMIFDRAKILEFTQRCIVGELPSSLIGSLLTLDTLHKEQFLNRASSNGVSQDNTRAQSKINEQFKQYQPQLNELCLTQSQQHEELVNMIKQLQVCPQRTYFQ
ncbi:uncharacterized protein LOC143852704 isoform X2 [Tasmannia lanceolata]|uniref:uncharacterized protein LOC143852704 isoform X2 n=1 Tax=Tasmannia lanceolata TaxID=3420 RepID=UPI004063E90C